MPVWLTPLGGILVAALLLARINTSVSDTAATIVLIIALVLFVLDACRPWYGRGRVPG